MKRVPLVVCFASAALGLGLAPPAVKAICLAGNLPSPCASGVRAADLRPSQSLSPLPPIPLAEASRPAVGPSLTYSLRARDASPTPRPRGGASVKVTGSMGPMVRVRYQIDAAPAPAPGQGLQIVIDSAAAAPQASQQAASGGGALPLAESTRTSFQPSLRSGQEDGFDALAPLALLGGGVALLLMSRPRGSVRPGI